MYKYKDLYICSKHFLPNVPKTFQWLAYLGIYFLGIFILYRFFIYFLLEVNLEETPFYQSYLLGLRFDLRWVAVILLPAILLSMFPGIHYFRTRIGKKIAMYSFTSLAFLQLLALGYDFLTRMTHNRSLHRDTLDWIVSGAPEITTIFKQSPWAVILILAGVGTWLAYKLAAALHHRLKKSRAGHSTKKQRLYWKLAVVLIMAFVIYGSLSPRPLGNKDLAQLQADEARSWATNAFQSFFTSF